MLKLSNAFLVLLFAVASIPSVAFADEGIDTGPAIADAPSSTWSGLYVGLHAGGGWSDTSIRDGGTPGTLLAAPFGAFACGPALTGNYCAESFDLDANGWVGGGQVGFNWRSGNFVFGPEFEFAFASLDEEKTLFRPFNDRDIAIVDYDWYSTITGRLALVRGNTIFFVKGGVAFAKIDHTAADIDLNGGIFAIFPGSLVGVSEVSTGWTIGGGIERLITERISLKAEYQFMEFGTETATSPDGDIYKFEDELHVAKVGINFHFPR